METALCSVPTARRVLVLDDRFYQSYVPTGRKMKTSNRKILVLQEEQIGKRKKSILFL